MTRSILSFVDTETTGLRLEDDVWEVALMRVFPDGKFDAKRWLLRPDLRAADSTALRMTRFYERTPHMSADEWTEWADFAREFCELTANTHLVGACVDFDARRLERLVRSVGYAPAWHYHIVDIEALVAGWLGVEPPWSSSQLTAAMGVTVDETERHTAMGDVRWTVALYQAWLEQTANRDPGSPVSGSSTASDEVAKPEDPQAKKPRRRGRASSADVVLDTGEPEGAPVTAAQAVAMAGGMEAAAPAVESPGSAEAADAAPSDPSSASTVEEAPAEHTQTPGATETPPSAPLPATAVASPTREVEQPWGAASGVIAAVVPKPTAAAVTPPPTEEPPASVPAPPRGMPEPDQQFACEGEECTNLTELASKPGRPSAAQASWIKKRKYLCRECLAEESAS